MSTKKYELTDVGREIRSLHANVYLAGPMTGIPEFNYPEFHKAAKVLRDLGIGVVSPAEIHGDDTSREREYYLRRDIAALMDCGAVVTLDGYHGSEGARLEIQTAIRVGMQVAHISEVVREVRRRSRQPAG